MNANRTRAFAAASPALAMPPPPKQAVKGSEHGLAHRSTIAFLWGAGGSLVRIALQLVIQIALARILGPEVYGIFALGILVVGVATYFADFGLAYGLIQKVEVSVGDVRFAWTWQCVLGAGIGAGLWLASPLLAAAFNKPEATEVIAWLAVVVLLNAMTSPSTNLLKKALDFRALQMAQLAAYLLGYLCVGLPMAMHGQGIHSLIAAMVVFAIANFSIQYWQVRHSLRPQFKLAGGWRVLGYGATVLGTNLVNWLMISMDKLMVGRLLPAQTVGAYTTAFNLVNSPAAAVYGNLQSVVFSASSRMQDDTSALRRTFLTLLGGVFLFAFPLFASLSMAADLVISGLYGARWTEATPYLAAFALAVPWFLVWGISTPILWNTGHTSLELRMQVPMALAWCAVLWLVSAQPGPTIAAAAASLLVARSVIMAIVAARLLHVGIQAAAHATLGGVALALACALVTRLLAPICQSLDVHPTLQMAALLLVAGAFGALMLLALGPWLVARDLAATLRTAAGRLPAPAAQLVMLAARRRGSA